MTVVLQIDPEHPQEDALEQAASIIHRGGLVAFPTETVYGLGADAMNEEAVQKIFKAKGRPADNPLIVHVTTGEMMLRVVDGVTEKAARLIKEFWPGPLTLIFARKPEVAASVSAGLDTVAVRAPANRIAKEFIRRAGTPVAAPSANLSGRPSPTTADHVASDLGGRIDMILDGGMTEIGIESTVVDMTTDSPVVLRPGSITEHMLAQVVGPIERAASEEKLRRSPGTRHSHYSPRARVILVEQNSSRLIPQLCASYLKRGSVGFIGHSEVEIADPKFYQARISGYRQDQDGLKSYSESYARWIYSALRSLDEKEPGVIIVEGISDCGGGAAVMDRLRRAASEVVKQKTDDSHGAINASTQETEPF